MTIGGRIKQRRNELGWSQRELCDKMGYSNHSTITKIEAGKVDIPQSRIVQFANVLNVSVAHLMGWEEEERKAIEDAAFDAIVAKDKDVKEMNRKYMALPEDKKDAIRQMVDAYYIAFADGK